jgi:hypothetical protein
MGTNYNMRARMQEIDRAYIRETDLTATQQRAAAANAAGDASKVQNVVLPVVEPQVESQLTTLSEIFLTSYPLFPVISKPQQADAALQMETVIGEQGVEFGWAAELLASMRDGLKYNVLAVEVEWTEKRVYTVENNALQDIKHGTPTETLFAGNAIRRINPYNLIADVRVAPHEVHTKGEYVGHMELVSRVQLKQRIAELDATKTMNAKLAFESGEASYTTSPGDSYFFIPQINGKALVDAATAQNIAGGFNWHAWAGVEENSNKIKYSNMYEVTTLYARIMPSEHKLYKFGNSIPQIWKLIIVNRKVLIYAELQSNAHNFLPIIVAQPTEDGLGWQSKSFADKAASFQATASALYNSGLESQRRKVYDRLIYDPSRINKSDIDNVSPVARIPIKSAAYGKPLSEAVYQMPYRDDNVAQIFGIAEQCLAMADVANGQNRVQRGQFQRGNKTRHEFSDTMEHSNARPRMHALILENRLFTPLKTILKLNTLQFQPPTTLYNRAGKKQVTIDPVTLRNTAMEFRMADGLMPTGAYINMELFGSVLQVVGQYPDLLKQWDVMGMIFYWLKLEGATWIDDFKIQQQQPPQ